MKKRTEPRLCPCGAVVPVRVRQCHECKKRYWRQWYADHRRDLISVAKRRQREQNARHADPRRTMLANAKQRAKRANVPCTIVITDIEIPATCPILGIPLKIAIGTPTDNSPSLDRLLPSEGYIRGNIAVISFRANAIKNSATSDELRAVADWLNRATLL